MVNSVFKIHSFSERKLLFDESIKWLQENGVIYFHSRLGKYQRIFEELIRAEEEKSIGKLLEKDMFPDLTNVLYETNEIINIYEGFKLIDAQNDIYLKLKNLSKGPLFAKDETLNPGSHRPRDIAFELYVTSLFIKANFKVDLSSECDLLAFADNYEIFLECKRPRELHTVRSNVKGAYDQLLKRFSVRKNISAYGLIALSINNIINPKGDLLVAKDEQALEEKMVFEGNNFLQQNIQHWQRLKNRQFIGVLIFFQVPAVLENRNTFTPANQLIVNNTCNRGSLEFNILNQIVKQIEIVINNK